MDKAGTVRFDRSKRLCAVLLLLLATAVQGGSRLVGEVAPDFVLKSTAGKNLRLSEYRGGVVLVTFWASWCGRCLDQLPEIERLRTQYENAPVTVLSVNLDHKPKKVRQAEAGLRLGFPVLLDADKKVARDYDPDRLPLTVLIDPAGVVRYRHEGFRGNEADGYAREIDQILAGTAGVMTKAGTQ